MYDGVIALSHGIRLCMDVDECKNADRMEFASKCFSFYLLELRKVPGGHTIFNHHQLLHIPQHCLRNGPIRTIDGSPFESFLHQMTKMIKCGVREMEQEVLRCVEKFTNRPKVNLIDEYVMKNVEIDTNGITHCKNLIISRRELRCDERNCYVFLSNGYLGKVIDFIKTDAGAEKFDVQIETFSKDFLQSFYNVNIIFEDPTYRASEDSLKVRVFYVENYSKLPKLNFTIPVQNITHKMIPMGYMNEDSYVFSAFTKMIHPN